MIRCYPDPTIAEVLADPLIRLVMKADGVDPAELRTSLVDTAARLARHPRRTVQLGDCRR